MVNKSPRKLVAVNSAWSVPQIMEALTSALAGDGPALTFAPSKFHSVPESVAVVIPTSGSTGSPKEVALSTAALLASAHASHQFLGATPGERWSLRLPTNHIAGVNVLVRALALGSSLVEKNFEYTAIVPTQLFRALNEESEFLRSLKSAKAVLVGGAAMPSDLLESARIAGINAVTSYGMSEMSGGCIYNGLPLHGVEVEIREDNRIALRGPMQALSYLGHSEPLADNEGWFLTSDAGQVAAGELIISGRIDDQINSGGEKISLGAIDDFLNALGVGEFMSCAISHQEWGQQLCLASSAPFDQRFVSQSLREKFGSHAVPKLFIQTINLPRTSIGKPDRQKLALKFEILSL